MDIDPTYFIDIRVPTLSEFTVITKNKVIISSLESGSYSFSSFYVITTDGGVNWDTVSLHHRNTTTINIIFIDSLHGYISTFINDPQYPDTPGVFSTTNGGESWSFLPVGYMLPHFSMIDSLHGILYAGHGNGGTFYRTSDGFNTWEVKNNPKAWEYFFYNNLVLYACGDSGYFAKSTDCGNTWTQLPFNVLNPTTLIENTITISDFSLQQNYPNPFNPTTKIKYSIAGSQMVTLKVYDILGNEISTLVNEVKQPGTHEVTFDGSKLSSGIYFYKLNSDSFTQTKKLVLIK